MGDCLVPKPISLGTKQPHSSTFVNLTWAHAFSLILFGPTFSLSSLPSPSTFESLGLFIFEDLSDNTLNSSVGWSTDGFEARIR